MVGTKQSLCYKKNRKRLFTGVRKQEKQDGGHEVSTENAAANSPVKYSRSKQKINLNCPIKKAELNQIMTRKNRLSWIMEQI